MNILSWILFGLVVGIIAHSLDSSAENRGILGSILLGIVGALVGGFLANLIFGITVAGFSITAFLVAVVSSLLLLFLGKAVRKA